MRHRDDAFDYVIVGAGAAGSVLPNRLSEDPQNKVPLASPLSLPRSRARR